MYILKLCFISIFGLACLTTAFASQPEGPGQSKTPGSYFARLEEPWQFEFGSQPDAENALNHQGYTFTWHGNPDTTITPDPTLTEWVSDVGADAGAFFHGGHGEPDFIAIEVYPHNQRGHDLAWSQCLYYVNHGYANQIYLYESASHTGWSVALSWGGVSSRCNFNDAVIDIETCCSNSSGSWSGARVEFVNDCYLTNSNSFTNTDAIWGGFDGEDDWKHRTACWAFQNASSQCHMRERQTRGGYTTLAPYIKWANFEQNDEVPQSGLDLEILFDTEVATVGSALNAFEIARPNGQPVTIRITGADLDNDTTLTATVEPVDGVFGTSYLSALSAQIVSKNNSSAHLDGSGEGGPDDKIWRLKHGQDPAAEVCSFSVDENGIASWEVATEYRTEKYLVQGRFGSDWVTLGTAQSGQTHYELAVGTGYPVYRLVEVETSGHEIMQETAEAHPVPIAAPDSVLTDDELRVMLDQKERDRQAGQQTCPRGDT